MLLEGKRLLVTGVLTNDSIAWHTARVAQEQGAEVVLTGFGRGMSLTSRAARRLPAEPEVLELDIHSEEDMAAVADHLDAKWGGIDGALHDRIEVAHQALVGQVNPDIDQLHH